MQGQVKAVHLGLSQGDTRFNLLLLLLEVVGIGQEERAKATLYGIDSIFVLVLAVYYMTGALNAQPEPSVQRLLPHT